jgi:large subunit ribosomal protein L15
MQMASWRFAYLLNRGFIEKQSEVKTMTLRKQKRTRRFRGSRTHGYGRIGQHRKGGQRGGKGKAGGQKHDWTYTTAKDPKRYGKQGFHRPEPIRKHHHTINVGDIASHLDRFTEATPDPKGSPTLIDLTSHGITKVLGGGTVPFPLVVTAPLFTHRAAEKIKTAGGKVKGDVLPAPEKPKTAPKEKPAKTKPKSKPKAKPKAKPKRTRRKTT